MPSVRWTAVGLAAGLVTALLGVTAQSQALSTGPAVGQCRQITLAQAGAKSNTTAPIPCSQKHDVRTILVKDLPHGMTWDSLTRRQIKRLGLTQCNPAFDKALGQSNLTRDRTMYGTFFFEPTKAQRADGANWIRCDLALFHGKTLATLPTDREPALVSPTRVPKNVKRCAAGPDTKLHYVVCTASHRYASMGAFNVAKAKFPGKTALYRAARRHCGAFTGHRRWFASWEPRLVWNVTHDHAVVCYGKSS